MGLRERGVTAILQSVEMRGDTDTEPSYFQHVLLAPILALVFLLGGLGLVLAYMPQVLNQAEPTLPEVPNAVFYTGVVLAVLFVLAALAAIVLFLLGLYRIIDRRNEHLARDRLLRQGLVDYCREIAEDARDEERVAEHVEAMERIHNQATLEENERPAAVHLVLTILPVPFWIYYVVYFLLKDVAEHARRQARFVREARSVFEAAGRDPGSLPPVEPVQERSFALSAALMFFLSGIGHAIVFYWLYTDPLEHFERQWAHENELVDLVESEEPGDVDEPEDVDREPTEPDDDGASEGGEEPEAPEAAELGTSSAEAEEAEPAPEPDFTVWTCDECSTQFKVPPDRPVRVTCKECGHKEILEE